MCGLFVSIGFEPDRRCLDAVAHRGPDGDGWRRFESPAGPVTLGHRRLSIIDLDARALQPMPSADGRLHLVFNGEIYNYLEIRADLERIGVRFRTTSDAEVLLEGYAVWGERVLDKLVGMFAFLIWDDRDKVLFLARDHVGVKPLFWHGGSGGLSFASEIKQFFPLQSFRRVLHRERARDFLATGLTDHRASTLFADARHVGAGDYARLDLKSWRPGDRIPFAPYWRPPAPEDQGISEDAAAEQFRTLFFDSIRLQMRADVRVGSCLSGGLDSSSIVAAQTRLRPSDAEALNVVSAVFPGARVDESAHIDAMVAASGATPHRVTLDPGSVFEDLDAVLGAQDEPYGSTSIHAQMHVFRAAKAAGVKVMLDGQGADEILGGYHGCFHYHYVRLIRQARAGALLRTLVERKAWHGAAIRNQLDFAIRRLPPRLAAALGRPPVAPEQPFLRWGGDDDVLAGALAAHGLERPRDLGQYCVALVATASLPMLLRYEDRNSMASSIEARVPFLDHRLVEFSLRLGWRHKIVGGDTKRVLRAAMTDILPDSIRLRRDKIGFATPEEEWFRGPLADEVTRRTKATLAAFPDAFDSDAALAAVRARLDGARPFDFLPWRLIAFGAWAEKFGMRA
ncbi:MAG: asparagine synthase (glutamine-hydrolyzing) [Parvularculaceae bacterium]|nr:asparagine synthase (glutamine-hydrolyzing) [Parvularculaceae bacterium]